MKDRAHKPRIQQPRTFSKLAPDVRRQQLIDATVRCLCRSGMEELTVRAIAAEADLSLGMVRHHFRTKDELLAATLQHLSDLLQADICSALNQAGGAPVERFNTFMAACLNPQTLDENYVRARFLFWGLAQTNEAVRRVHDKIYGTFEKQVRALVSDIAEVHDAEIDTDIVTLAILALLKGIWVEWSLRPDRADPLQLAAQILPALGQSFSVKHAA